MWIYSTGRCGYTHAVEPADGCCFVGRTVRQTAQPVCTGRGMGYCLSTTACAETRGESNIYSTTTITTTTTTNNNNNNNNNNNRTGLGKCTHQ